MASENQPVRRKTKFEATAYVSAKVPRFTKKIIEGKEVFYYEVHLKQETSTESLIQGATQMSLGYSVDVPEKRLWVRYSQFETLQQNLSHVPTVKQNLPPFPKKLLRHSDAKLENRRIALEHWIAAVVRLSMRPAYSDIGYSEFAQVQQILSDWCGDMLEVTEKQENREMSWRSLSDKIAGEIYAAEQFNQDSPASRGVDEDDGEAVQQQEE